MFRLDVLTCVRSTGVTLRTTLLLLFVVVFSMLPHVYTVYSHLTFSHFPLLLRFSPYTAISTIIVYCDLQLFRLYCMPAGMGSGYSWCYIIYGTGISNYVI